ncbi:MAG: hypothetical protein RLO52_35625 [Sandaracinaceae bacterium]
MEVRGDEGDGAGGLADVGEGGEAAEAGRHVDRAEADRDLFTLEAEVEPGVLGRGGLHRDLEVGLELAHEQGLADRRPRLHVHRQDLRAGDLRPGENGRRGGQGQEQREGEPRRPHGAPIASRSARASETR